MGRDYHIFCSIALSMPYYLTTNFNILLTVYQHCAKEGFYIIHAIAIKPTMRQNFAYLVTIYNLYSIYLFPNFSTLFRR